MMENKPQTKETALIVGLFLLLGTGVLLPWNAFLTAVDLFTHLYTTFPFEFVLSLFYNISGSGMLFACIWISSKLGGFGTRLCVWFGVDLLALVIVPIFAIFVSSKISVWLVLLASSATGAATAVTFGAGMGLASFFGPKSITAFMTGNGISGLVVSVLRILTKISLSTDETGYSIGAGIYFGSAAAFVLACIIGSTYLVRLPVTAILISQKQIQHKPNDSESLSLITGQQDSQSPALAQMQKPSVGNVFKKIWLQATTVWLVFFVTLSLFPGVITLIKAHPNESSSDEASQSSSWIDEWFSIILISIFMIGDFLGRSAPSIYTAFNHKTLWIPTAIRFVFFPLFALFAAKVWTNGTEIWAPIIVALFALTNGYFGTLSMMYGSAQVVGQEQEVSSTIMAFSLNFGIFCASIFAIFMLYFIRGKFSL